MHYNNAWIYATPRCCWIQYMLEKLCIYDPTQYTPYQYTLNITGPNALTSMVNTYQLHLEPSVRIFPHIFIEITDFSTSVLRDMPTEQVLVNYPWAIGIHRNEGSWLPMSIQKCRTTWEHTVYFCTNWSDQIGFILGGTILLLFILLMISLGLRRNRRASQLLNISESQCTT